jgi:hypothetical protein
MSGRKYPLWTSDDIAKLRIMAWKERRADIAAHFGRSVSATQVKAHKLGISLRLRQDDGEEKGT